MNEEKNSVKYLQCINFSQLKLQEKLTIKALGRVTPNLAISQMSVSRMKQYKRNFNLKLYSRHNWLTGCSEKNALFCFPCLLFGNDSAWTKRGVDDIKHFSDKIKKHEKSAEHIKSVCNLKILGQVNNVKSQLKKANYSQQMINDHNEKVKKNCKILSKIIDCIVFCGRFELKYENSGNFKVFKELLEYAEKLEDNLRDHYLNSTVFKKESLGNIHNELLECILSVCQDEIRNEIKRAKYLAVMVDDMNDISEHAQQVIVFRYELEGIVRERFWGFFSPNLPDAEGLAVCVTEQLRIALDNECDKLIAQTYDNADGPRTQAIVKKTYKNAHFINCYAHRVDLLIETAASQNLQARIFFFSLAKIPEYFEGSPKHLAELKEISERTPHGSNIRWKFDRRLINTVFKNKDILERCFESLQTNKNRETAQGAVGILRSLNDINFNFWLKIFYEIMLYVEIFDCKLQSCDSYSSTHVKKAVKEFRKSIDDMRNNLLSINGEWKSSIEYNNVTAAKEVCGYIMFQMEERFRFLKHLSAAKLLIFCIEQSEPIEFPLTKFKETMEAYPMLDEECLKKEICVLNDQSELKNLSGLTDIYNTIYNTGIFNTFTEVSKLWQIIMTTPMGAVEPERCFSTRKKIKTFLRNSTRHSQLSASAMLSVENNFISNISDFNKKVLNKFVNQEERRNEFHLK